MTASGFLHTPGQGDRRYGATDPYLYPAGSKAPR